MYRTELFLGLTYFRTKHFISKTQYYTREGHLAYQKRNIANLLTFASREIPFYKKHLTDVVNDINPENALPILENVPYMSKSIIRKEIDNLFKPKFLRSMKVSTGGSSASPMPFYMDRLETRQKEKAFMWDQWRRIGYLPGLSIASFTGNVPQKGKLYSHNKLFNLYVFSSFDLVKGGIKEIIEALDIISPLFIHGYPSTIASLAKLIKDSGFKLSFTPQAVLCGSEKTFDRQRTIIEEVFGATVYTWYGHSEYSVLGGECEVSKFFHIYPQYGYVEFLPTDIPHESGKKLYEIVATGFNNHVMPFIRYRTGDYAVLSESLCSCGREYPLIEEVVGRLQEFLVDSEENLISLSALTSLFEKETFIDEVYLVQEKPGEFHLCVLPQREALPDEISSLTALIKKATADRLTLIIDFVTDIPKTTGGKRRLVDQKIDLESYV